MFVALFTSTTTIDMAYNREWDRGKDNWDNPRHHNRDGDDDYYGDGKRRKFNNGVCPAASSRMLTLNLHRDTRDMTNTARTTIMSTTTLTTTTTDKDKVTGLRTIARTIVRGEG